LKFIIDCKSLLLQKALEEFLEKYISEDGGGLVISDEPFGDVVIGRDINKPFTRSQLLLQLEKIWEERDNKKEIDELEKKFEIDELDMDIFDELMEKEETKKSDNFEKKLDKIIDEFTSKLKNLIKEEYGKKQHSDNSW
jgi:hypothetical protein